MRPFPPLPIEIRESILDWIDVVYADGYNTITYSCVKTQTEDSNWGLKLKHSMHVCLCADHSIIAHDWTSIGSSKYKVIMYWCTKIHSKTVPTKSIVIFCATKSISALFYSFTFKYQNSLKLKYLELRVFVGGGRITFLLGDSSGTHTYHSTCTISSLLRFLSFFLSFARHNIFILPSNVLGAYWIDPAATPGHCLMYFELEVILGIGKLSEWYILKCKFPTRLRDLYMCECSKELEYPVVPTSSEPSICQIEATQVWSIRESYKIREVIFRTYDPSRLWRRKGQPTIERARTSDNFPWLRGVQLYEKTLLTDPLLYNHARFCQPITGKYLTVWNGRTAGIRPPVISNRRKTCGKCCSFPWCCSALSHIVSFLALQVCC